jgi:CRP/FNR family transcriptional regulator
MVCSCANCHIKTIFFESLLNERELEKYCNARSEITIHAGETIIKEGDAIRSFKYLYEGLIKIHRTNQDGTEQIISIGKPMDFVSIHNIFSGENYNYSVTALEDSKVCRFDLPTIKDLIKANGLFAQKIIETTNAASNQILTNSLNLISKSMYGKVASVLLFFLKNVYFSPEYNLPISRKEIAQYTGLTIETVIRVISSFRRDGLIKVYGKRIEIIDREGLEAIFEHS